MRKVKSSVPPCPSLPLVEFNRLINKQNDKCAKQNAEGEKREMNRASPHWMLCSPAPCIPTSFSHFFIHTDSIILPYPPVLPFAHPLISFVGCHCLLSSFFFYRLIDKQTNKPDMVLWTNKCKARVAQEREKPPSSFTTKQ